MRRTVAALFGASVVASVGGRPARARRPRRGSSSSTRSPPTCAARYDVRRGRHEQGRADRPSRGRGRRRKVLSWFENPSWTRHVIATGCRGSLMPRPLMSIATGFLKSAIASGFSTVPAKSLGCADPAHARRDRQRDPWTSKEFDKTPAAHRLRWIDAAGNGRKLLINAPLAGVKGTAPDYKDQALDLRLRPRRSGSGRPSPTQEEGVVHGLYVIDWDGKGTRGAAHRELSRHPPASLRRWQVVAHPAGRGERRAVAAERRRAT